MNTNEWDLPSGVLPHHVNVTHGFETYDLLTSSPPNSSNDSRECSNDYCISDEDYLALIQDYIFPSPSEWVLIALHVAVFAAGLVGNALVCVSVYRNHAMRTVTNYFIVNLAVADFLVILVCLPPTVLWDVTETWFFGSITCKLVLYLQGVSVSVSVLTLTFISVDRWYAICCPLRFKSTASRARKSIVLVWAVSAFIALPEALVLETDAARSRVSPYLVDCTHAWSEREAAIYQMFVVLVLYVAPFSLMACTYYQISQVLWSKDIPGDHRALPLPRNNCLKDGVGAGRSAAVRGSSGESQIQSRRKASKMLMAVVVMFSLCYLPVHLINVLRVTIELKQTPLTTAISLISHWLCYANSAVNPIIYNIMNSKFRKEFRNMFTCQCLKKRQCSRSATSYLCKYTSTVTHCDNRIQELKISNFA